MNARRERDILEGAVRSIAERASQANAVVDEAHNAGLDGSHPVTLQAKMLRLELLNVKADLERELGRLVLHCTACANGTPISCATVMANEGETLFEATAPAAAPYGVRS